jgi:hypothetical protein
MPGGSAPPASVHVRPDAQHPPIDAVSCRENPEPVDRKPRSLLSLMLIFPATPLMAYFEGRLERVARRVRKRQHSGEVAEEIAALMRRARDGQRRAVDGEAVRQRATGFDIV